MPDLLILHTDNTMKVNPKLFFVEMKSDKGKLTEEQIYVHGMLKNMGIDVYMCRSLDEFVKVCNEKLKP